MDEYQFGVNYCESLGERFRWLSAARRVASQMTTLQICHQAGNELRVCELKTAFPDVDLPVFARPDVNRTKPKQVHAHHIGRREAVFGGILLDHSRLCQQQGLGLREPHIAHPRDSEPIAQHAAARSRLEFGLDSTWIVSACHLRRYSTSAA